MDVNGVCRSLGVQIPQVAIAPEDPASTLQQNIDLLEDTRWLLEELLNFLQLSRAIRDLLQPTSGIGLSNRAQTLWQQATRNLMRETHVPEADLPIEEIARRVLTPISAARAIGNTYPGQENDILILSQIVDRMSRHLTAFQQALAANDHPFAAGSAYDTTRSFRANIRAMLSNVESLLITAGISVDLSQINWDNLPASVSNIEEAIRIINNTLIHPRCASLAEALQPPVITPPVAPPPPPPPPPPPQETAPPQPRRDHWLELALELAPAYAGILTGNGESALSPGPSLDGRIGVGLNIRRTNTQTMRLQFDWRGRLSMESFDDFVPHASRDTFTLTLTAGNNVIQAGLQWVRRFENNPSNDFSSYVASMAYGRNLLNGGIIPYAAGLLGGASRRGIMGGGQVGVRGQWVHSSGFGIAYDGQYSFLASGDGVEHQINFFLEFFYRFSRQFFWHSVFEVGARGFCGYESDSEDFNCGGMLVFRLTGEDFRRPLPMPGE